MMLLGKRPRPPIKRTTSMTGITVDLSKDESQPSDHSGDVIGFDESYSNTLFVSPRNSRRSSGDFNSEAAAAHFLRTCGLCRRRLSAGRDIYMYRGDTAFCSQDCRELQMKQDEKRDKNPAASPAPSSP